MFDFMPQTHDTALSAAPVLCLSGPMGSPDAWIGITECIGAQGACRTFAKTAEMRRSLMVAPDGAHLIAEGTAAYDALRIAMEMPHQVRSITLIDPDIITALPDLDACPQFYHQRALIRRASARVGAGRPDEAAAHVTNWWMGRRAWDKTARVVQIERRLAMPAQVLAWKTQDAAPLNLARLVSLPCPVRIITGRRAPSDIRSLVRLLRVAVPNLSLTLVKGARGASHLTDPHIVGPEIRNFIVSNDLGWHTQSSLPAAA